MEREDAGGGSLSLCRLIDEYGAALIADLWFYYKFRLDLWVNEVDVAPAIVLSLIQRLPQDSLTAAMVAGGREHFGWTQGTHLLADILDMSALGVRVTGNWRKKPPEIPAYPRPGRERSNDKGSATAPEKPTSKVASLFRQVMSAQPK